MVSAPFKTDGKLHDSVENHIKLSDAIYSKIYSGDPMWMWHLLNILTIILLSKDNYRTIVQN